MEKKNKYADLLKSTWEVNFKLPENLKQYNSEEEYTEEQKKKFFEAMLNIAKSTIGLDISCITPMSDEEAKEWYRKGEELRKKWEADHPEEVKEQKAWEYKYSKKKPYTLKPEEREIVKELLNTDYNGLDSMSIEIYPDGELCVRTPQQSWIALAGREWCINLKNKTHRLTAMS